MKLKYLAWCGLCLASLDAYADIALHTEKLDSEQYAVEIVLGNTCSSAGGRTVLLQPAQGSKDNGSVIVCEVKHTSAGKSRSFLPFSVNAKDAPQPLRCSISNGSRSENQVIWQHKGSYRPDDPKKPEDTLVRQLSGHNTAIIRNYNKFKSVWIKYDYNGQVRQELIVPEGRLTTGQSAKILQVWYPHPYGDFDCREM